MFHTHFDICACDSAGDLDNDGLSNLFEYHHNLSISDADSDHDGINDGEEFRYWNETRGIPNATALQYCLNPDVDGDNITDGKRRYKCKNSLSHS